MQTQTKQGTNIECKLTRPGLSLKSDVGISMEATRIRIATRQSWYCLWRGLYHATYLLPDVTNHSGKETGYIDRPRSHLIRRQVLKEVTASWQIRLT